MRFVIRGCPSHPPALFHFERACMCLQITAACAKLASLFVATDMVSSDASMKYVKLDQSVKKAFIHCLLLH